MIATLPHGCEYARAKPEQEHDGREDAPKPSTTSLLLLERQTSLCGAALLGITLALMLGAMELGDGLASAPCLRDALLVDGTDLSDRLLEAKRDHTPSTLQACS